MRSVKINKIAAIGLLMVVIGVIQATPDTRILTGDVEYKLYINGNYPKVGEVFEVVFRVRLKSQNDLQHMPEEAIAEGYVVSFGARPKAAVKLLSNNEIFIPVLNLGEWQEFVGKYRITKPSMWVTVGAEIRLKAVKAGPGLGHTFYLLDSLTGQYGTKEEYDKQLRQKAEWWYDPAGEFTGDPVHPDCVKKNREIIAKMQEINSNLTDWEALYLHYDGIQALIGGMGDRETTSEEHWRFLLDMGWLEKQRAGKAIKDNWLNEIIKKYKGKPLTKEQGLNPNFFRGDNWYSNSSFSCDSITKENLI